LSFPVQDQVTTTHVVLAHRIVDISLVFLDGFTADYWHYWQDVFTAEVLEQDAVQKIARADLCFDNHAGIFKISLNLGKIIGCTQSWVAKIKDGMKVSQDIQPNGGA